MLFNENNIQVVNRTSGISIPLTTSSSSNFPLELSILPGFSTTDFPYLIMRDENELSLVNLKSMETYKLLSD